MPLGVRLPGGHGNHISPARTLLRRRSVIVAALGVLVLASLVAGIPPVRHAVRSAIPFLRPELAVTPVNPGGWSSKVQILSTPDGNGYWVVQADAGIFTYGDAEFHGSNGGQSIPSYARGMAALSSGHGYWETTGDGSVYTWNTPYYGGANTISHSGTIVGIATPPSNAGYWQVASDGGIFSWPANTFAFYGSKGGQSISAPMVGMAVTIDGGGYWEVGADGNVYSFGDANPNYGNLYGHALTQPVTGLTVTPSGRGYWLVAADGGVFCFGDAVWSGSVGGGGLNDVMALAPTRSGLGYWLVRQNGTVYAFGDAGTMQ
jgi:hypothetical protein